MTGWVPLPADWWPMVAGELAQPWPREAVWFDLRWWADKERMGEASRPGRVELQARWGWTEWKTKAAMRSEEAWGDPVHLPPTSHAPPTDLPLRVVPTLPISEKPPTDLPLTSHRPPHARVSTPDTGHSTHEAIWERWRSMTYPDGSTPHGKARLLTKPDRKLIKQRLGDGYTEAEVVLVLEWVHQSAAGAWWREKGRTGMGALLKGEGFSDRLEQAQAWQEAGEVVGPTQRPLNGHAYPVGPAGDDALWNHILQRFHSWPERPDDWRWHDDDGWNEAIRLGLYAWGSPDALYREDVRWRHKHREQILHAVRSRHAGGMG